MWEEITMYAGLFIMAATPWLEILFVIPLGVALGLHPVGVAIVSFIGNILPIFFIVYLFDWFIEWRKKRKQQKSAAKKKESADDQPSVQDEEGEFESKDEEGESESKNEGDEGKKVSKRKARAARILQKYGVPGVSLLGPVVTGIHLAAVIALTFRSSKSALLWWMNISLGIWTIVITLASFYSIDWLTSLLGR